PVSCQERHLGKELEIHERPIRRRHSEAMCRITATAHLIALRVRNHFNSRRPPVDYKFLPFLNRVGSAQIRACPWNLNDHPRKHRVAVPANALRITISSLRDPEVESCIIAPDLVVKSCAISVERC